MSDNNTVWQMPDWMKPLEPFFQDKGLLSVAAEMNTYSSKCASRLASANLGLPPAPLTTDDLHGLLVNAQVGLLVALKGAGLLLDKGTRGQGDAGTAEELAAKVDGLFDVPTAVFMDGSVPYRTLMLLRKDVAATLAGRPLEENHEKS